jgi:hypothetical protein
MEHCKEPHPYPQRMMIHQKGLETLKKSNQNKNPKEAQELKKEKKKRRMKRQKETNK